MNMQQPAVDSESRDLTLADIESTLRKGGEISIALDGRCTLRAETILRYLKGRRLTLSGELNGRPVVVKFFNCSVKARREYRKELGVLSDLAAAGVPVPEPFLQGSREKWSFYVAPLLAGTSARQAYAEGLQHPKLLQRRLARTIRQLFEAGYVQTDLHLDNFIVQETRLVVLDPASMMRRGPGLLGKWQLKRSLMWLAVQFNPTDLPGSVLPTLAREGGSNQISSNKIASLRRRRADTLVRKSLRNSTRYRLICCAGHTGVCQSTFWDSLKPLLEQGFDDVMANGDVLKLGNSATVVRYRNDQVDWVIKRYNLKKPRERIKRQFSSRAQRSWTSAVWLRLNGLTTPQPVAFLSEKLYGFRAREYFICEYVSGELLKEFTPEHLLNRSDIIRQLADILAVMRNPGFSHGDFKAANFIVDQAGRLQILDMDAMQPCRSATQSVRAEKRDRERLLRNWGPEYRERFNAAIDSAKHADDIIDA